MKKINLFRNMPLLAILAIAFSQQATAAVSNDDINSAIEQLRLGKPQEAQALLLKTHDAESTNPQEWFLLGVSAKQAKQLGDARRYLAQALVLAPKADRIKLELAEVNILLGDGEQARALLLEVKAGNPPERVTAAIDRYLLAIDQSQAQQKNWQLTGSLGWMHDSNVNGGPDTSSVQLFGLPFTLSDDARMSSDQALTAQIDFSHLYKLSGDLAWQNSLGVAWTDYQSLDKYDALYLSASSSVLWRQNERLLWSIPILLDQLQLGHDDSYYYYSYGITPQFKYLFSPNLSATVGLRAIDKKYQNENRNAGVLGAYSAFDFKLDDRNSFRLSLNYTEEHAERDYYSNAQHGIGLAYYHAFAPDMLLALSGGYGASRYEAAEAAFGEKRRDEVLRYSASFSYRLAPLAADLVVAVNYTDSQSNISLYEYDRWQSSIALRKTF